jgi:hypothetical protein
MENVLEKDITGHIHSKVFVHYLEERPTYYGRT